ncbi:MAG: hypothetical protein ACRDQF_03925 [Thermocrispum sp.]
MLMAAGGSSGDYIRSVGEAALRAGKAVADDIAFDAAGVDKVIQRLEDVIDQQTRQQMRSRRTERRAGHGEDAEDWASSYYSSSADSFDENYGEWNEKYVARLKETVEKFKKVKAHYMQRDDEIGEQFRSGMNK